MVQAGSCGLVETVEAAPGRQADAATYYIHNRPLYTIIPTVANPLAQLRVLVRRVLRRHGYPTDKQEQATQTVFEQAEVLSEGWAFA